MKTTQTGINEQTIAAFDARRNFGKLLDRIKAGIHVIVEEYGEPVGAFLPLAEYKKWKQDQEETLRTMLAMMDEAANNANLSEEEASKVATDAVTAIRAKKNSAKPTP